MFEMKISIPIFKINFLNFQLLKDFFNMRQEIHLKIKISHPKIKKFPSQMADFPLLGNSISKYAKFYFKLVKNLPKN